jgi:putative glycosyltransferase (TIGR04348 family)
MVTPAPAASRQGNRITALRWKRLLTELGHRVRISTTLGVRSQCDLLIALHARKSHPAVVAFKNRHPGKPVIVALTGTDLYDDLPHGDEEVAASIAIADHLVVLQPKAIERLPAAHRSKATAVLQSVAPVKAQPSRLWKNLVSSFHPQNSTAVFAVAVLGHLREVKDPLRTAEAVRTLPKSSGLQVVHLGGATAPEWKAAAEAEMKRNPRYHWLGDVSHRQAIQLLRQCKLLVVTSRLEGGANVVMEAIALGVPVLSTRIDGSVGILGENYPGYFAFGDTKALRSIILRCETDRSFYNQLKKYCSRLQHLTTPARERDAWKAILARCFAKSTSGRTRA